jgi:four helix bundle protein
MRSEAPYEKLKFYQNICQVRKLIHRITERFPKTNLRLISQMRDAARSAKQNIREGYRRDTAGEFMHAIKIGAASLGELEGDIDDCCEDNLITQGEYGHLKDLLGKTNYQINRYLEALIKMAKEGTWKSRFQRNRQ